MDYARRLDMMRELGAMIMPSPLDATSLPDAKHVSVAAHHTTHNRTGKRKVVRRAAGLPGSGGRVVALSAEGGFALWCCWWIAMCWFRIQC